MEDARGDWLWQVCQAASATEQLRAPLLAALQAIEPNPAAEQHCQLARHFALAGDGRFTSELRRIVAERAADDTDTFAEEMLIRLEGPDGFLAAASRHGAHLDSRDWEWFDREIADYATKWLGADQTLELLATHSATDLALGRFREGWMQARRTQAASAPASLQDRMGKFSVNDVFTAAQAESKSQFSFRGWGDDSPRIPTLL